MRPPTPNAERALVAGPVKALKATVNRKKTRLQRPFLWTWITRNRTQFFVSFFAPTSTSHPVLEPM